jgi:hypothetical protein
MQSDCHNFTVALGEEIVELGGIYLGGSAGQGGFQYLEHDVYRRLPSLPWSHCSKTLSFMTKLDKVHNTIAMPHSVVVPNG